MATRSQVENGPNRGQDAERRWNAAAEGRRGLRTALRVNAAFSGASGLVIAVASSVLPGLLGAGTTTLYLVIGVFLVAFAVRLALLARGESISRSEALMIVAGDWGWVAGSAAVIGMGLLTPLGTVLVGATALVVGSFAVWQGRNLPRERG
ncbi:MAG: hypothetical protein R3223_05140 [Longimicrobiales bacterium]|nr:hypothetical protein [Longimicrobiales bacterium]